MSEEQKQKSRERARAYYFKNKEKVLSRQKEYARNRYKNDEAFRNKQLEYHKNYEKEHLEVIKESKRKAQRKYYQNHKEYYKNYSNLWAMREKEKYEECKARINKAIEIYENSSSIEYKKKRFMEGKTTADLMYEALQGEDK